MWDNLNPAIVARLPRPTEDPATNGTAVRLAAAAGTWEECLADLERYREYGDDWDGQAAAGIAPPAKAVSGDVIDSAAALAASLRRHGVFAPHSTWPGVRGTVGFEWALEHGGSISLEVTEPGSADLILFRPDKPTEHLVLTESIAA